MTQTYIETASGRVAADAMTTPKTRLFREAWDHSGDVVHVDMGKARNIWRDKIRMARKAVFERLDADFMKAMEQGDTALQASIATQKQALRDAPDAPEIEAAQTPEELAAFMPAGLTVL